MPHTYFNSLDPACKTPFGAIPAGQEVTFRLTVQQYAHRRRSACRRAPERAHGPLPPGALYAAVNGVLQPGRDLNGVVFHLACIHFHFSPFSR